MDTKHEDQQIADSESYAKVAQMEAKLAMIKAAVAEKANQIKSKELELHIINAEQDEARTVSSELQLSSNRYPTWQNHVKHPIFGHG